MPEVNIMGALVSNVANFFIPFVINHYLITKVLGYRVKLGRNLFGPLVSAGIMGIVIFLLGRLFGLVPAGWLITSVLTMINIVIGMGVYAVSMLLTGGITSDELNEISPRIYRMIPKGIQRRMK